MSAQILVPKYRSAPATPSRAREIVNRVRKVLIGSEREEAWRDYKDLKTRRSAYNQSLEYGGRRIGSAHGSYVTDLAECAKGIVLCSSCQYKFNPNGYGYYRTREFNIQGRCDACREHAQGATFFIHESLLGRKSGQCWTPR